VIADQQVHINNDVTNFLGPELRFEGCEISFKTAARNLIVNGVEFFNCKIVVKKQLSNFSWNQAIFENCKFEGKYTGHDFGQFEDIPSIGNVIDCDFSEAVLDGCRFLGCDPEGIVFPLWRCFTIIDPLSQIEIFKSIKWEGKSKFIPMLIDDGNSNLSALSLHSTSFASPDSEEEKQLYENLLKLEKIII
jgi:uncharacterized protein YjbI with pentapeptide repeats